MTTAGTHVRLFIGVALIAMFILVTPGFAAEPLSLPARNPELGVAPSSTLGTNEEGVGLSVGEKVADFAIDDFEGESVSWAALVERGPLLVVFYRGGWCPYCNVQVRQLSESYSKFKERGVLPVLISVDKVDASSLVQNTYEIPFPVLSDPDGYAHEAFGVFMEVDEATFKRYKEHGIDLEAWSGRDDHKIGVPSAFFVDDNGTIRWAHSDKDYRVRPSPQQLLDVADRIHWWR